MANSTQQSNELDRIAQKQKAAWAWQPPLPIVEAPVIVWPPRPLAGLKYIFSLAYLWSVLILSNVRDRIVDSTRSRWAGTNANFLRTVKY
jgi:hypothetical protein